MAREESDREDLIQEATGLVDRVEYQVDFVDEPIVVGFRRDDSISFFFGQNRVYQFNNRNELRRCYLDGQLLKAERGKLVRLTRHRVDRQVQLVRHELSDAEQTDAVSSMVGHVSNLKRRIQSDTAEVLRSVSASSVKTESRPNESTTAEERVAEWMAAWSGEIEIAATPRLAQPKRNG